MIAHAACNSESGVWHIEGPAQPAPRRRRERYDGDGTEADCTLARSS
jgi:hypothetical protein